MQSSAKFTGAQRIRSRFMQRRPLEKNKIPNTLRAVFQACELADQVRTAMLEKKLEMEDTFSCALVVRHDKDGIDVVTSYLIAPDPDKIGSVVDKINALTNAKFLGILFRIIDLETTPPAMRDWARPFLTGPFQDDSEVIASLRRALEEAKAGHGDN